MTRVFVVLAFCAVFTAGVAHQSLADRSKGLRGAVWIQPAFGQSIGDDRISGEVDADISVTGIPIIGSVGETLPLGVDVEFADPSGILVGGELIFRRFGIEVNVIYLPKAAKGRGGLQICDGLLTESECELLRQGVPLIPGIPVPDFVGVEKELGNAAATAGANYHIFTRKSWGIWAGPMVVWSIWDNYDVSDVRVDIRTSLETLLQAEVDQCEIANLAEVAPKDALTYGLNLGGRYNVVGRWSLLGHFRYFAGDDLELPRGGGSYSAVGVTVGLARLFGG